jgi:transglutaminase-like putative cysteine protease
VKESIMLLTVSATADYDLPNDTYLLLMVEPALSGPHHRVTAESLRTTPTPFANLSHDALGNPRRCLLAPRGFFTFDFQATIEAEASRPLPENAPDETPADLPPEALLYTLPSRCCPSDLLRRMARAEFGGKPGSAARVRAIRDWVQAKVTLRETSGVGEDGDETAWTTACDTATRRAGTCRDAAHLIIALCRALRIPARYVSGYRFGAEASDFHGYAQVHLGGAWYDVDPVPADGSTPLIPIAIGRDAAEVAPVTLWGAGRCRERSVQVTLAPYSFL